MSITSKPYGTTKHGEPVTQFCIENAQGLKASFITFGAVLTEMWVPDRTGKMEDITLGFDNIAGYESSDNPYFGCTVGRYANRLGKGQFTLNGKNYQLLVNNGANHLHGGGPGSLCWKNWTAKTIGSQAVAFSVKSHDGEEGYPGNIDVTVTMTLTDSNELVIDYRAQTDQDTILNLTNHAYWNLAGHASGPIDQQRMQIFASSYLPRTAECTPTGDFRSVEGTPLDYRQEKTLAPFKNQVKDFKDTQGFDHSFVLDTVPGRIVPAATAKDINSGRRMEVFTSDPCVHLYSAGFIEKIVGKKGVVYGPSQAFCLECQNFPDAPHHPNFPTSILKKGEIYMASTVHRFGLC